MMILSKLCLLPFEKESTLKEENLLPLVTFFFLLALAFFQNGTDVQESKQEDTKVVSLVTNG